MADQSPPPHSSVSGGVGTSIATVESHKLQFSLKITEKLNEDNFPLWRQQIEPYINAHNLTEFVVCPRVPPQFLDDAARAAGTTNPAYTAWRSRDGMLLSWLQSTISREILARVIGCSFSYELWDRLFAYFQTGSS
jgi:hypothetical protein